MSDDFYTVATEFLVFFGGLAIDTIQGRARTEKPPDSKLEEGSTVDVLKQDATSSRENPKTGAGNEAAVATPNCADCADKRPKSSDDDSPRPNGIANNEGVTHIGTPQQIAHSCSESDLGIESLARRHSSHSAENDGSHPSSVFPDRCAEQAEVQGDDTLITRDLPADGRASVDEGTSENAIELHMPAEPATEPVVVLSDLSCGPKTIKEEEISQQQKQRAVCCLLEDRADVVDDLISFGDRTSERVGDFLSKTPTSLEESPVLWGGEVASSCISGAARWMGQTLGSSVPPITKGINVAGEFVKAQMDPLDEPQQKKERAGVAAKTYVGAVKRATGVISNTARTAAYGIRDASTRGINHIAGKFQEENIGPQLVPEKDVRDAIVATGKVGLASLGAVAIVSEAVYNTTKAVARETNAVTAEVARYKYGDTVGTIIEDAGETTGNVLGAIKHLSTLEGEAMTKKVARNTGKVQVEAVSGKVAGGEPQAHDEFPSIEGKESAVSDVAKDETEPGTSRAGTRACVGRTMRH